jgi:amino acid transporter
MPDEEPRDAQPPLHRRRIARPHRPVNPAEPVDLETNGSPPFAAADRGPAVARAAMETRPPTTEPEAQRQNARLAPDVRLREIVHGKTSKSPYVRVLTTEARSGFRRRGGGILQVTLEATAPRGGPGRLYGRIKALAVGAPMSTAQLAHERLPKTKALAVFSSDALSSSAYATEEILLVLVLVGTAHLGLSIPIALAITLLLTIVAVSYRQTIRAYPSGGGAYIVAKDNLGDGPAQVAAAALLVDYILTVSVSVAAGVAAIISALPELEAWRVAIGVAAIAVVTLLNLRGVRESGTIFAIPTYAFIFTAFALLAVGAFRVITGNAEPVVHEEAVVATQGLTLFLILRAFSSGCAALTGVEAISNGVPAFKVPESRNASTTLTWMAVILGTIFIGFTLLAHQYDLIPSHDETIVSQLGRVVFGENAAYYVWQAATALILLLAANTAYADFPRLASILAKDDYMPHQFAFRGDRLAFSNGIIVLGVAAAVILWGFGGQVTRLIPLYAVGVFVSFTLSQGGMVVHWRRLRERGWGRSLVINAVGATATALVALIITATKFTHGAWMTILIGVVLVLFFRAIHGHYVGVARRLELPRLDTPWPLVFRPQLMIVPIRRLNRASVRALSYANAISQSVTAVHVSDDLEDAKLIQDQWDRWAGTIPLVVIESPFRSFTQPLLSYIDAIEDHDPNTVITVVLPEFLPRHWWQTLLHNQDALRLKAALLFRKDTVVIDVPQHYDQTPPLEPAPAERPGVT